MCTHVKSLKMKGEANISNTAQSIYVASNVLTLVGRQIEGIMWFRRRRHPNPEPLSRPLATDWEINRPTHVATHTCIKWPHHHSKWSSYVGRAQKSSKWEMRVWAMYQPQFGLRGCLCGCSCGRKTNQPKIEKKLKLYVDTADTNPGILGSLGDSLFHENESDCRCILPPENRN